jgi:hypothetical protein
MKKLILIISAAFFAYALHAAESETVKGAKKDMDAFKKEMSVKLESLEKQIAEIKTKAQAKGGEAKAKTVADLESARDSVKAKMAALSENSKDSWQSMKKSVAESVDSLNAKVQKALHE